MSRRRGLGRGLDALLGEETAPLSSLPVGQLRPNQRQPRSDFDEESLAELAESIRAQGVVQPIVVTGGDDGEGYTIIAGERRWRAARRAGLDEVPVVVRQVADEREMLELALVENLQRSDLNPLDEAEAYRALADDFGLSQQETAARVGKSRAAVANTLRLLRLPAAVKDLLRAGDLTAGQVRPLLALPGEDEQVRLAERAVVEGLSARELERLASAPRREPRQKRQAPRPDVHSAAAAEKLTQRLQTKVEIRRHRRGGELRIHFYSEEELMRVYDLLMRKGA